MNVFVAWNTRLRASHPDHLAIVRGMAWVTLFVMVGKLSGAGKEMAIAWRYGVGAEVDGYLFVLNLVSWPLALWFSVLTMVLVPLAARLRNTQPQGLPAFRAELLGLALCVGLLLALVAAAVAPAVMAASFSGLPPATLAVAQKALPGLLLLLPLGVLASLFSAWMLAAGLHANTLLEGVPALVIALAVVLFDGGVMSLVWGTVIGAALHMACLATPLARRGELVRPRLALASPAWRWFGQGFLIMLAGNALMSLIDIVDMLFAVQLGTGTVSTLSYGNRVLALLLGLGGTAISRATLPVFSNAHHHPDGRIHQVATLWVGIMFACGTAAMLAVWLLASPVIHLLFERGAFDARNTEAVAGILRCGAVQLPFYFAALVLVSSLVARGRHRVIAIGAAINLAVKVAANLLLVPLMGAKGIVLATAIMYLGSFGMLFTYAFYINQQERISE